MSECINWPHARTRGYGVVHFGDKTQRVHRLAYRLANDLDEKDMPEVIMHTCDNPSCYNVEHLVGGTQIENLQDMRNKSRHNLGVKNRSAVLTDDDIPDIRRRIASGEFQRDIAADYGIGRQVISDIKLGKTWGHI